jgi:hypothetical protein
MAASDLFYQFCQISLDGLPAASIRNFLSALSCPMDVQASQSLQSKVFSLGDAYGCESKPVGANMRADHRSDVNDEGLDCRGQM